MSKAYRLKTRKSNLPILKSIPINFLLGCPENALCAVRVRCDLAAEAVCIGHDGLHLFKRVL